MEKHFWFWQRPIGFIAPSINQPYRNRSNSPENHIFHNRTFCPFTSVLCEVTLSRTNLRSWTKEHSYKSLMAEGPSLSYFRTDAPFFLLYFLTITLREVMWMNRAKFEEGLQIRREVLGNEYVDKAISQMDEFSRPLQELVTEYCWGTVWARPELPRKIRSIINLAMLTALNRPHELKIHIRGALNNGCTKEEIREVLLQTAIYCGVPAAVDSFRVMKEVFAQLEG